MVPVSLVPQGQAIASLSTDIAFDATTFEPGPSCVINASIGAGTAANKSLVQSALGPGRVRVGILGMNNNLLPAGALFSCEFDALASATPGTYVLAATAQASRADGSSAPITAGAGSLVVSADGDGDGIPVDLDLPACAGGAALNCSDNCPGDANPTQGDQDSDAIGDACDSCIAAANEGQVDSDDDGFGNACDCDFNQNSVCNIDDFSRFLSDFASGTDSGGVGTDMNASGSVNIDDFILFLQGFAAGEPGPSSP